MNIATSKLIGGALSAAVIWLGASAPARANGNFNGSNWSDGGAVYTIGSGAVVNSGSELYFQGNSPASGTYTLNEVYNGKLWSYQYSYNPYTINGTGAWVFTGDALTGAATSGIRISPGSYTSDVIQQINVNLYVNGGKVTFANQTLPDSARVGFGNKIVFGAEDDRKIITGLQTSNDNTLTELDLFGTGEGIINSHIQDGTGQGAFTGTAAVALKVMTTSTWTLTGSNTYTGPTEVQGGGWLVLDNSSLNAQKISTNALTLGGTTYVNADNGAWFGGGGNVEFIGSGTEASSQSVSALNINLGANSLTVTAGGGGDGVTFGTGVISRVTGAAMDFTSNNGGVITTTNESGDLGGWATFGRKDFATVSGGTIVAAGYDEWNTDANVSVSANDSQNNVTAKNLQLATPVTLTLAGSNTLTGGGIVFAADAGAGNASISGGSLTAGSGEFVIHQHNADGVLNISSALSAATLTKAGAGEVMFSGVSNATTVNITQGTVRLGADNALGTNADFIMSGPAVFDLNGHNQTIRNLSAMPVIWGQDAIHSGVATVIGNYAVGTSSTLTLAPTINADMPWRFSGDFYEAEGAIFNLTKTGGGIAYVLWRQEKGYALDLNGNWVITNANNALRAYDLISGNITTSGGWLSISHDLYTYGGIQVGAGGATGLFQSQQNTAATRLNVTAGSQVQSVANFSGIYVNMTGADAGRFDGQLNNGVIVFLGSGSYQFTALQTISGNYANASVLAWGSTFVELPGFTQSQGAHYNTFWFSPVQTEGQGVVKLTGTDGVIAGTGQSGPNGIYMAGGTIWIAPAGSDADVEVSGMTFNGNTSLTYGLSAVSGAMGGNSTLLLDRGANTSLNFSIGNSENAGAKLVRNAGKYGTLIIAAGQDGLDGLGVTEKLTILGKDAALPVLTNGIMNTSIIGADSKTGEGGFLTTTTFNGGGVVKHATYTDTNFASASATSIERVTTTATLDTDSAVYALRNDGTLTNNAKLTVGTSAANTQAGVIMNSAVIDGTGTLSAGAAEMTVYVSGSSRIENTIDGAGRLTVFGDGLLKLTGAALTTLTADKVVLNSGVLEVDNASWYNNNNGVSMQLQGGVLQTTGTINKQFNNPPQWVSGGFAASSTSGLVIDFTRNPNDGSANKLYLLWTAAETWTGNHSLVLDDAGVMVFGSRTAKGPVELRNNLYLGQTQLYSDIGDIYQGHMQATGAVLWRNIQVVDNPDIYEDYAMISGDIDASDNDYKGILKTGDGLLILNGNNTYAGPTSIAEGTLAIYADNGLGAAPDAAAPYTGYVNRGTVLINGGAALYAGGETAGMVINANRQILLASGADGARGANIAVQTGFTAEFAGRLGDSVDEQGSLLVNGTAGGMSDDNIGGILKLTGTSTISGFTEVVKGTLLVDGELSTANVVVDAGATLGGAGELATSVGGINVSGILDATAALTLDLADGQKLNFTAGSVLLVDADSALSFASEGDWLNGSGNATLELTGNFDYTTQYTVLTNITTEDFSFAAISGYDTVNYEAQWGLSGNSYILSFDVIPEPSTWVLIITGVALLTMLRRRR
ncbi:MAG: autotransporter-associated beta strand repeat-containing protein [Verrucomicrobiales bacterium]|jgi:fibronectin-binding autotransporter adhesin|nr:autotransporter-associated beta strand repeat-containing protein [Verrucomicrobiales bacterium]